MPTIIAQLTERFAAAIHAAFGIEADPLIGPSQNPQFGDYQSNAAMPLAKKLGQKPREIAEQIKAKVALGDIAQALTIAGPGFINVTLSHAWLAQELQRIESNRHLGIDAAPKPQRVVVDYSGPNVAKEMHVGHLRSTIIGDAISRVLEFQGHTVIRQNHVGDWGTQFGMLIAFIERQNRPAGADAKLPELEELYRAAKKKFDDDPGFAETARQAVVHLQGGQPQALGAWKSICAMSRAHYQALYERLGVKLTPADERGESAYNADLPAVVTELKQKGLAETSDGATVVFIDGREKPPMIVQKGDGAFLYSTTDLAAIRYRANDLHANRIVYVHDSRQVHHFAQLFAVAKKAGWAENVSLEYAPFGTMLGEDGKPFKTRSGDLVKLDNLLTEATDRALRVVEAKNPQASNKTAIANAVGIGAVKYSDLAKDRVADYVFSFDKMLALDGNTAPYLQYAHARIRSIFRKARELSPSPCTQGEGRGEGSATSPSAIPLESPFELALAKHILRLGECLDMVARDLKPHLLCTYLYDLAVKFSGFYENCQVIKDGIVDRGRLALCQLTAITMATGLDLLGIQHPDQM
ncbi:MAG: arginine--tRNA ligase [Tepidisphaeraceae bacterium]